MPFVLCHAKTGEIFSCRLLNIYELPFHGVKFWNDQEEAEKEYASFLLEQGEVDVSQWRLVELDEHKVKLCNVKLNNNPRRSVFLGENGQISAKNQDASGGEP